jgi:hypothetical protein
MGRKIFGNRNRISPNVTWCSFLHHVSSSDLIESLEFFHIPKFNMSDVWIIDVCLLSKSRFQVPIAKATLRVVDKGKLNADVGNYSIQQHHAITRLPTTKRPPKHYTSVPDSTDHNTASYSLVLTSPVTTVSTSSAFSYALSSNIWAHCHRVFVLPPGVNPIAVDKYININIYIYI